MLTEERWASILDIVEREKAVSVPELEAVLGVSASTIRRDLTQLNRMGKLVKVHGGATSIETQYVGKDITMEEKYSMNNEEKQIIGRYAAGLIGPDDFVYIDAGTTTSRLIDFIENDKATYVTNGIVHARKLIQKGLNAYMVGGKVKPVTEAVVGAEGINNLKNLNFSKAFMGTNGIDLQLGYTTPDIEEAMIKEMAINQSYMAFIIADHTKFRRVFPVTFSPLTKCCIITDALPDTKYAKETIIKEVKK